ncbi:Cell division control protein Cdc48, AAA+ ATPasefamily [Spraguea lophii 42_110]|uniref:Cell division control protein Cdc48, AAA+ ATPasefamily n=1 Tax=Spraguea lophii (strain 42_110) TaxID=1358809 RepID=S7WDP1_SPRLO|nr:Cell division control protein Cdc48, AAA+ ATPasefamily [Spraguea lophii 42_110]
MKEYYIKKLPSSTNTEYYTSYISNNTYKSKYVELYVEVGNKKYILNSKTSSIKDDSFLLGKNLYKEMCKKSNPKCSITPLIDILSYDNNYVCEYVIIEAVDMSIDKTSLFRNLKEIKFVKDDMIVEGIKVKSTVSKIKMFDYSVFDVNTNIVTENEYYYYRIFQNDIKKFLPYITYDDNNDYKPLDIVTVKGIVGSGRYGFIKALAASCKYSIYVIDLHNISTNLKATFFNNRKTFFIIENLNMKMKHEYQYRVYSILEEFKRVKEEYENDSILFVTVSNNVENLDLYSDYLINIKSIGDEQKRYIIKKQLGNNSEIDDEEMCKIIEDTKNYTLKEFESLIREVCVLKNAEKEHDIKNNVEGLTENISNFTLDNKNDGKIKYLDFQKIFRKKKSDGLDIDNVKFSDIGGYEDLKLKIKESVIWPLIHKEKYNALDTKMSRGILLYGPPGCCKTMIARAIANETKMSFISIKSTEVMTKWVGESEKKIRDLFEEARRKAPCIIFIDEIDAICRERRKSHSNWGVSMLATFLMEMDGFKSKKDICVIAATNRKDAIDKALLRPGRFDRHLKVDLPDIDNRREIFKVILGDIENIDINILTDNTEGCSGADIKNFINEAKLSIIRKNILNDKNYSLTTEDIMEVIKINK